MLLAFAIAALVFGLLRLGAEWTAPSRAAVEIDLSPWALPAYALYSLSRGLIAYVLSLIFTLVYGYWAAKSAPAERVLVPMLDVLQSIPVLGFMPALVIALVSAFPSSHGGLQCERRGSGSASTGLGRPAPSRRASRPTLGVSVCSARSCACIASTCFSSWAIFCAWDDAS